MNSRIEMQQGHVSGRAHVVSKRLRANDSRTTGRGRSATRVRRLARERGDPLAELIRVQCDLAQTTSADSRIETLHARERELLAEHDSLWLKPIRDLGFDGQFNRGFVDVSITGAISFLERSDALFAMPWVLHVDLKDSAIEPDDLIRLSGSPAFFA